MTIRSKIFTKHSKQNPPQVRVTETVSATVSVTHYHPVTPEAELAKWEEVLETLGETPNPSSQEALAREVIRKHLRDLRKRARETGKRD